MNKNQEINVQTTLNTQHLFLQILSSPDIFRADETLKLALKSQGKMAKYQNVEQGINTLSLNTLKSLSDQLLEGGYAELDKLRINARNALNNSTSGKVKTDSKAILRLQKAELERNLEIVQQSCFLLTTIIKEMRSQMSSIVKHDKSAKERLKRYEDVNKKIEAQLSYINGRKRCQ